MPLHRFNHNDARQKVAELEAAGETITSLASDETGIYVSTTTPKKRAAGAQETR